MQLRKTLRKYSTAWRRRRRSAGFGVHSPHAFSFIVNVLRGRGEFYDYAALRRLRATVARQAVGASVMPTSTLLMLYRVVNRFSPNNILQVGTDCGVTTACMASVSSTSCVWLYDPHLAHCEVGTKVVGQLGDQVKACDTLDAALAGYDDACDGGSTFALITAVPDAECERRLRLWLDERLAGNAVIIMYSLWKNAAMQRLWRHCCDTMTVGQTFTNDRVGIAVASPKLQREHYNLWL